MSAKDIIFAYPVDSAGSTLLLDARGEINRFAAHTGTPPATLTHSEADGRYVKQVVDSR